MILMMMMMMMLTVIDEYDDDDDEYDFDDAYSNDDDNWLLTMRICWYYTIASNLNIRYFDIKFYKVSRDDLHVNDSRAEVAVMLHFL